MKLKQAMTQIVSNPTSRTVLGFTLAVYLLEEILFQPQLNYMAAMSVLPPTQLLISAVTAFVSLLALSLFIYAIFSGPRWLQVVYFLLYAVAVIVEYGYQKSVDRFLIAADLQMGMRTPLETWMAAAGLFLDWRAVFPIVIFVVFWARNPVSVQVKKSLLAALAVFMLVVGIGAIRGGKLGMVNLGASPIQFLSAVYQYSTSGLLQPKREQLSIQSDAMPMNNIVLIVDESVSGDQLSLNGYSRPTTPYLELLAQQERFFHNWGVAVSGATCSEQSNGLLISGVPIAEGNLDLIYRYPSLFQYGKMMNYETYYIDAQTNTLWNGLSNTDIMFIDNWITSDELGPSQTRDFAAADMIHEITTNSTGNFFVLNKRGVHFLYESNYPEDSTIWSPTPVNDLNYSENLAYVNNAYDNAILYNNTSFFRHLFPDPEKLSLYTQHTYYLYTSDHGQTLYRDQTEHIHCGGTYWEARVPLIAIGQFSQRLDTRYPASHSNILPTILDLMAVPHSARVHIYPQSLLTATMEDSRDRLFFAGSVDVVKNYDEMIRAAANN